MPVCSTNQRMTEVLEGIEKVTEKAIAVSEKLELLQNLLRFLSTMCPSDALKYIPRMDATKSMMQLAIYDIKALESATQTMMAPLDLAMERR